MAVTPLKELIGQQRSGVKSLTALQEEQRLEVEAGTRDPVLGAILPARIPDGPGSARAQFRDALMRKFHPGQEADDVFGPGEALSDRYWGRVTDEVEKLDDAGKVQTFYQLELGFSPKMAVGQTDQITQALFGKPYKPSDVLTRIGDYYRQGQLQVQMADLGLEVLMGRDTAATWSQIERLRKARKPQYPADDPWWAPFAADFADQVPLMGETVQAAPFGAIVGGAAGMVAGAVVSGASPTIGEESLIPSLTWSGIKLGAGMAGAARVGQLEAGGAVLDLLEAGVDPAVAKSAAFGIGVLNGAIELGQISTLIETLPGGKKLLKGMTGGLAKRLVKQGTLRHLATEHAARFGGFLAAETLQELAQESVSVTAEEAAKYITEELGGDVDHATLEQIKERMLEVGTKSLRSFTVLGIPGSTLSAAVDVAQLGRRDAVAALLPDGRDTQILVPAPEAPAKAESGQVPESPAQTSGPSPGTAAGPATPEQGVQPAPGGQIGLRATAGATGAASGKLPGGRQSGGTILFDPNEWIELVKRARSLYAEGAQEFGTWSETLVASVGEEVRPALRQLWQLAVNPTIQPEQVQQTIPEEIAIARALGELSYEALAEKAREIGVTVRGKKAQLAALIAEAIKAKAGPEVRRMARRSVTAKSGPQKGRKVAKLVPVVTTRIADKKALADTEKQIREHGVYQLYAEGAQYVDPDIASGLENRTRSGRVDPDRVYYVDPKYQGEVEGVVGKRGAKGYNGKLAGHITFDPEKGTAWDGAIQEQGLDLDFSGFLYGLEESLKARELGPGGINEAALKEGLDSGDWSLVMLATKREMLRAGRSAYDINKAMEQLGSDLQVDREAWDDLLIGGGMLLDPDDPHPGSLSFREFFERLGREIEDPSSEWVRRWQLAGIPEKPKAWHKRLVAEWDAIQATGVAAELNIGQLLAEETQLTDEQEEQINAIDGEKVAAEIVEREKQTMFARLLEGFFEEAEILGQLRTALRDAYRSGADEGIAKARQAYRAQRQKIKAQKEMREYVAQLLREIKRPVGKTVAFVQRQAIEALQAEIDPQFRSKRTTAERAAARRFFAEHPEAQAPARVLAMIQEKTPGELTIAEIEQTAQAVRELRQKGKILRRRDSAARAERLGDDVGRIVQAVDDGQVAAFDPDRPIVRPPEETRRDRWWSFYASTLTPERLFDWLDQGKDYLGSVFQIFWERVADAESAKLVQIRERTAKTVAILKQLQLTYQDLQATALTIGGEEISVEMAVGIYNFMRNYSSRLAITFGNGIRPEAQERVRAYVEEERPVLKELADWIVEQYDEHYARLRQAVIEAEDRDMGREDNYTPMRRLEADYTPDERQILTEMMTRHHFKRGYAEKGMTLMRQDIAPEFQKPIRLDAWSLLLEQVERQEHYIAMARLVKDLQALVGDDAVKEAVRRRGGKETWEKLQNYVNAVGNPNIYKSYGQVERWLRRLRRHTAIAFLAWKVSTILKQPVSLVRYLPHAGLDLVRAGLEAASDWGRVRALVIEKDPLVAQPALERELEELKAANPAGYEEMIAKIGKAGMEGIVWMDGIARTIGWYATYLHEMGKHGDEVAAVKAARLATSTSQAGARVFQLPELYRTNQEAFLLLTQFTNELNKLWNITTYDLPTLLKNKQWERAAGTFVAVGLEATLMWMIANRALPKDEEDGLEIVGDQLVSAVPVLGPVIVSAAHGFGGQGVPAWEGAAQSVLAGRELALEALAGDADQDKILDASHKIYKGLAPWAGLPYTGPRDIARTILKQDLGYLLGGTPKRKASAGGRSGSGQRGSGRRGSGRRR